EREAMRTWLDCCERAARSVSVDAAEDALRAECIELPAGSIESADRQFTVRMARNYPTADDFSRLAVHRRADGYLIRLGDVARVEKGTEEDRNLFRGRSEERRGGKQG